MRCLLRESANSPVEHLQEVPRTLADGANHAKQARVSRRPTKCPRIVVVDFADQQALTPRIESRRRGSGFPDRRGIELQILNVAHLRAQRIELRCERRNRVQNEARSEEHTSELQSLR